MEPSEIATGVQNLIVNLRDITPTTLLQSFILILVVWLVRYLVLKLALDRVQDVRVRYQWQKISTYVATVVSVTLLGAVWLRALESFATYVGLLSAGLAIALRDPLSNVAGWLFIVVRRPFSIGDRVEVGPHAGDVVDIRLFEFSLAEIRNWIDADQSTGRIVHVPNRQVLTEPLANFSQGLPYIWHELPVLITFESDWQAAKQILREVADRHAAHLADSARDQLRHVARKYMLIYNTLTPTVYTRVEASGVLLTIRCLCEPRQRRGLTHAMWEDILQAFAEHDQIEFAYPTQRLYMPQMEHQFSDSRRSIEPDDAH